MQSYILYAVTADVTMTLNGVSTRRGVVIIRE